jgi:ADP-ribose pyrophosphatase
MTEGKEAGPAMSDLTEHSIESANVFRGVLLNAFRDTVRLPGGGEGPREWIDHPGAAAVVPLFSDGTVLLVRQYRFPPRKEFLEIPAGKLDVAGESPEEVARRELQEETGYKCGSLESLTSIYPCIGYSNEIIHLFIGRDLTPGRQSLSDGEFVEPVRMTFDEALALVADGTIDDAKTVTALLLTSIRLKSLERVA